MPILYKAGKKVVDIIQKSGEGLRPVPNTDNGRWLEWSFIMANLPKERGTKGVRLLDVGCGNGYLSTMIASLGFTVTGLDVAGVNHIVRLPNLEFIQADILDYCYEGQFDIVVACSTVEHIGVSGRYGQREDERGDLKAMDILSQNLGKQGVLLLTIPVGRDTVIRPYNRVYGRERLPLLLASFDVVVGEFWHKVDQVVWERVEADVALDVKANEYYSALGTFKLAKLGEKKE